MADLTRTSDPISERAGEVGYGAVLYDTRDADRRPCCAAVERPRHLYHVTGIREDIRSGAVTFVVEDGTHTTRETFHADDLLALFEPAGFTLPTGVKPTYILTREHGVRDLHDRMLTRTKGWSA
jgi:hypothetical protein